MNNNNTNWYVVFKAKYISGTPKSDNEGLKYTEYKSNDLAKNMKI